MNFVIDQNGETRAADPTFPPQALHDECARLKGRVEQLEGAIRAYLNSSHGRPGSAARRKALSVALDQGNGQENQHPPPHSG